MSLRPLEEDHMGEELVVVWELEVGHTVIPNWGLPEIINAEAFNECQTLSVRSLMLCAGGLSPVRMRKNSIDATRQSANPTRRN
jgi:hypothetical protein